MSVLTPKSLLIERIELISDSTLKINFCDGMIIEYTGSMKPVYEGLAGCSSVGKFWHKNIKEVYEFKRIR